MNELPKTFDPSSFEKEIYQTWEEKRFFHADINPDKKPYVILMPPPNITGILHMGHVLNNTIQDIFIRYYRMKGLESCWIPGVDHASIATEAKVTKWLQEQKIDKKEIGREKFLDYTYQWKEKYGNIIINQLKTLGASADWDRLRFTMDEKYYKSVIHAFVKLYNDGYIYRGYRLVNWCPVSKSAISDEEVYYKEEQGSLWYFRYPLKEDNSRYIVIATTRPETLLGDTAVAVHPDDPRYQSMIGKTLILPIVNREIKIIADTYVDPKFGTGAVKITPAHDPNDYEMGLRHNLEMINIFNIDASLNENTPKSYQGLDRYIARKKIVEEIKALNLLEKIENLTHSVGYSERGHVPIESLLSNQWFMKMGDLVKPAIKAVTDETIEFYPNKWVKTYLHWLTNVKDWCISRQLWWGQRIPIFTCEKCNHEMASEETNPICPKCGGKMIQEEDVLDTWASSWLWPFAVHNWPEKTKDLEYFYPSNTLVTAPEIIFFWVARMIIAGYYFMGKAPFTKVYFTGIIRDQKGRKMSKSLGNSPDPLDVIAEYGADALRYTITRIAPIGNDILYDDKQILLGRNFANKIYNSAKFIQFQIKDKNFEMKKRVNLEFKIQDSFDAYIYDMLNTSIKDIHKYIENMKLSDMTYTLYELIWNHFCDWYIESSKTILNSEDTKLAFQKIENLLFVLDALLRMLHPLMPFITEYLFENLFTEESSIMFQTYPSLGEKDTSQKEIALWIKDLIYAIRNIRGEHNIAPNIKVDASLVIIEKIWQKALIENEMFIKDLAKCKSIKVLETYEKNDSDVHNIGKHYELYLHLETLVNPQEEKEKLEKEHQRVLYLINSIHKKLDNEQFTKKAPDHIIQKEKEKLQNFEEELLKIQKSLEKFS